MKNYNFIRFDEMENIHLFSNSDNLSTCGHVNLSDHPDCEVLTDPISKDQAIDFLAENKKISTLFCGTCIANLFADPG